MKIAITGHTAGIGKTFAEILKNRGHEIIGISRSEGENIHRTNHVIGIIEPCDFFINNAQSLYAQTQLLYGVWKKWQGQKNKFIWNISTQMAQQPINSLPKDQDDITMSEYRNQKIALEGASQQLRWKNYWPVISVIRPGAVATEHNKEENRADVHEWVNFIIDIFSKNPKLKIEEISVGPSKYDFKI